MLEDSGYSLLEANSGQHGLDLAAQEAPELIVLDAALTGVDGWTILAKLQDNPKLADIPVVILSAVNDTDMAFSLGATTVINKPIDAARLTAEIAMLLTPLSRNHVLLVEDDADSRTLVSRMLERENWSFRTAASGKAALRALKKSEPAIILLDLKMSGMNGFEVLELVQKNPVWTKIPVIIISSMDITQEMRTNLAPRALAILKKGQFSREELTELIRPAIQSSLLARS